MATTHQIDVYWEFESAEIMYKKVVQVKDWSKPVDQGELLKFKSVLDDLPEQPKGVIVTRTGYQSGASEYARIHGILLFELKERPTSERPPITLTTLGSARWEVLGGMFQDPLAKRGLLELVARITVFEPKIEKPNLEIDSAWAEQVTPAWLEELPSNVARAFDAYGPADVCFYDESGNVVTNLHAIYRETVTDMVRGGTKVRTLSHRFSAPTFVATGLPAVPRIKISGLSAVISIEPREPVDCPFELPNIVTFILRNLKTGKTKLITAKNN
jgi:hypothetical protein